MTTQPVTRILVGALLLLSAGLTGCDQANPASLNLNGCIPALRQQIGVGALGECYPEEGARFRSHGTFDLMVYNKYDYFPEVANKMPQTQTVSGNTQEHLRSDASTVTLTGALVSLDFNPAATGPLSSWNPPASSLSWYVPLAGMVLANDRWRGRFPAIPSTIGEQLQARFAADPKRYTTMHRILLNISIEGEMADGTTVRTQEVSYPIDLCWGCLVALDVVPAGVGVVDPEAQYAYCTQKAVAGDYIPPCVPGNDEYLPCGYYCAFCDLVGDCDERFCPSL